MNIIAFPCNQFNSQEPRTNAEIKAHVQETYGITFDMMSKIKVNGDEAHPVYKWLKSTSVGRRWTWHRLTSAIQWNYTNFLVDKCGNVRFRKEPANFPNNWEDDVINLLEEKIIC